MEGTCKVSIFLDKTSNYTNGSTLIFNLLIYGRNVGLISIWFSCSIVSFFFVFVVFLVLPTFSDSFYVMLSYRVSFGETIKIEVILTNLM